MEVADCFLELEEHFNLADWLPWFLGRSGAPDANLLHDSLSAGCIFFIPSDLEDPCFRARLLTRACTGSYNAPAERRIKVRLMPPVWPQEWESSTRPAIDSFRMARDQFDKVAETGIPLFQTCFNTAYLPSSKLLKLIEDPLPFGSYNDAIEHYFLMSLLVAAGDMQGVA